MDFVQDNILNLVIFFPALAAFVIFLLPEDAKGTIRRLAFIFSLVPLLLVVYMWFTYDRFDAGIQFEYIHEWFPAIRFKLSCRCRWHQPDNALVDG